MKLRFFLLMQVLIFVKAPLIYGQKLPSVQTKSLAVPQNIKIDGKADEWNGFQAYNTQNVIYYSLANDKNNLYLIVKSDNNIITNKILLGGLKFTIHSGSKQDRSITYPMIDEENVSLVLSRLPVNQPKETVITARKNAHKEIIKLLKTFSVKGLKTIKDSEISIYNDLDISVAASFDGSDSYICEFALPLKYFTDSSTNLERIEYTLTLLETKWPKGMQKPSSSNFKTPGGGPPLGDGGVDLRILDSDTSFKSEYILSK